MERIPVAVSNLVPDISGGTWMMRDASDQVLGLQPNYQHLMPLLAVSGGHPMTVFGEFDGQSLLPLRFYSSDGVFTQTHAQGDA